MLADLENVDAVLLAKLWRRRADDDATRERRRRSRVDFAQHAQHETIERMKLDVWDLDETTRIAVNVAKERIDGTAQLNKEVLPPQRNVGRHNLVETPILALGNENLASVQAQIVVVVCLDGVPIQARPRVDVRWRNARRRLERPWRDCSGAIDIIGDA